MNQYTRENKIASVMENRCVRRLNGKLDTRIILICTQLLIIYFEDGTFQVIPCLVSIKAKEVSIGRFLRQGWGEWYSQEITLRACI